MASSAILLFAHGAREPEWARPFEEVRDRLRVQGLRVELAYLEIMKPTLEEAVNALAAEGAMNVTVVPLFLARGKHLKRELPKMIDAVRRNHAGMELRITPALGEEPEILSAITAWARRAAR